MARYCIEKWFMTIGVTQIAQVERVNFEEIMAYFQFR